MSLGSQWVLRRLRRLNVFLRHYYRECKPSFRIDSICLCVKTVHGTRVHLDSLQFLDAQTSVDIHNYCF